jgi:hypothetical protein
MHQTEGDMDQTQERQLQDTVHSQGVRAGRMKLTPSLNPYNDDDPLHHSWRSGWHQGVTEEHRRAA